MYYAKKVVIVTVEQGERVDAIFKYFKNRRSIETYVLLPNDLSQGDKPNYFEITVKPGLKGDKWVSAYVKGVVTALGEIKPDFVYVCLPPDELGEEVVKWCGKNNAKSVVDIGKITTNIAYKNNYALKNCNKIVLFSNEYKRLMAPDAVVKSSVLFPFEPMEVLTPKLLESNSNYVFGAIMHNFLDIDYIINFLNKTNKVKPVTFSFFGECDRKGEYLAKLDSAEFEVKDYGVLENKLLINQLMNNWHMGLNICTSNWFGISEHVLTYFANGVSLINNVASDMEGIIGHFTCGLNIMGMSVDAIIEKLERTSVMQFNTMRENTRRAFEENFVEKNCVKVFDNIINNL